MFTSTPARTCKPAGTDDRIAITREFYEAGPDVQETCRELIPVGQRVRVPGRHREGLFPVPVFADMHPSPHARPSLLLQVLAVTVNHQPRAVATAAGAVPMRQPRVNGK